MPEIPNPDDDTSEKANCAIEEVFKRKEAMILYLASVLKYDTSHPNTIRRIIAHSHRIVIFFEIIQSQKFLDESDKLEHSIKEIRKIFSKTKELFKIQSFFYEIGICYIEIYSNS